MTYGEKIALLRKQHNMTQAELGTALNVTFQAVSKWENGLSEPDLDTIKKMCVLFGITVNEFFDMEDASAASDASATPAAAEEPADSGDGSTADDASAPAAEEPAPATPATPPAAPAEPAAPAKPVLGYCDRCRKPLYDKSEYVTQTRSYHRGRSYHTETVKYCKQCQSDLQAEEKQREKEAKQAAKVQTARQRKTGFIWGAVGGVVLSVIMVVLGIKLQNNLIAILGGILGVYGGFAFISQMIWGNTVMDCFEMFLKSFHLPGIIFTLDLDGILFLITVKVIGGILCAILSVLLFLVGLVVTIGYSMITFPIAVIRQIRGDY